jgi:NAD(P)H-hydrate epimerase
MRELDSFTINEMGVPSMVLMERAALSCLEVLRAGDFDLSRTVCLCGTGNNGGDGMAVARLLACAGYEASIFVVGERERLSPDAASQLAIAENYGVDLARFSPGCLRTAQPTTLVDALFGVGLSREVTGDFRVAIEEAGGLAAQGTRVLAVDIPSGVSADTGEVLGVALPAYATVTFAFNKIGLTREPAKSLAGKLTIADIGIYENTG